MYEPRLELPELFRRTFMNRAGVARLVVVVICAAAVGVLLGVTSAPQWVRTLSLILGVAAAGTFMFVPAYRQWRKEQS